MGLKHAAIQRMKNTWKVRSSPPTGFVASRLPWLPQIPEKSKEMLETIAAVVSPMDNWYHFRKLLEQEKDLNYIPYIGIASLLLPSLSSPSDHASPHSGLFLADLTFIKDGPGNKVFPSIHSLPLSSIVYVTLPRI